MTPASTEFLLLLAQAAHNEAQHKLLDITPEHLLYKFWRLRAASAERAIDELSQQQIDSQ